MTEGLLNSFFLRVVPPLFALFMRLWFRSCRITVHNFENVLNEEGEVRQIVASFWHYSIIYLFYFVRKYSATAMVSASRDGEYIAKLAEEFGFKTIRGSKNYKGTEALKSMLRAVREGENGAIVADGSQGPPRVAQPGAILIASRTGVPIVPMLWSASSYFAVKSWDRTIIPKPFCRVDFFYGEPLLVPARLKADEMEEYRLRLEKRLNALYGVAWAKYNKIEH